jgi:hypothetical protein
MIALTNTNTPGWIYWTLKDPSSMILCLLATILYLFVVDVFKIVHHVAVLLIVTGSILIEKNRLLEALRNWLKI